MFAGLAEQVPPLAGDGAFGAGACVIEMQGRRRRGSGESIVAQALLTARKDDCTDQSQVPAAAAHEATEQAHAKLKEPFNEIWNFVAVEIA